MLWLYKVQIACIEVHENDADVSKACGIHAWLCGCCRWVSLNKAATQIVTTLPAGELALSAKYSNTVTKLFQSAVNANFTAVRLFLHGEDEGSQLQTQPGQPLSPLPTPGDVGTLCNCQVIKAGRCPRMITGMQECIMRRSSSKFTPLLLVS